MCLFGGAQSLAQNAYITNSGDNAVAVIDTAPSAEGPAIAGLSPAPLLHPSNERGYNTANAWRRSIGMPGRFTVVKVGDPHLIGRVVWESLSPRVKASFSELEFTAREWAPFDRRRFRIEPEAYRTEYSIAEVGDTYAGRIADARATHFSQRPPASDIVRVTVFERGAGRVVLPGSDEPVIGNPAAGWIWGGEPGTSGASGDDTSRLFLRLPARLLRQKLEALLDGRKVESIAFHPVFDQTRSAGATIRRMLGSLFAELEHLDSLLANEIAVRSFEEHLALCLLLGLPHSHSERLGRQNAPAAPRNVRRAEEFMRANAEEAVTIAEVAQSAGCSIRALQLAFRRFRDITPMEALRRIRLEQARQDIVRPDGSQSVIGVAAKFGFANPGRFANQYKRAFGEFPSEALHRRSLRL